MRDKTGCKVFCAYCGQDLGIAEYTYEQSKKVHCNKCGKDTEYTYNDDLYIRKVPDNSIQQAKSYNDTAKNSDTEKIRRVLSDESLRGSIYSTIRCIKCGEKLKAETNSDKLLRFYCNNRRCNNNAVISLTLEQLVAVINFNPLI